MCTKISEIFETGTNGTEISRERAQKIGKLLNFRKANNFSRKFRKSNRTEISRKVCLEIWVYLTRSEIMQIRNLLFSASSFGRNHSELDISRKDDGDAYSKIEIL